MRTIPTTFAPYQYSDSKEPLLAVEIAFDAAGTDLVYFTSHTDVPLPGGAVSVAGCIEKITSTSQRVEPDQARSTIGTISVKLIDKAGAVSTIFKARDDLGRGLRGKRIRVYQGFRGMDWATLSTNLILTQIVDDLKEDERVYTIVGADVQRSARNDIFNLATTSLSQTVTADQMLIPVWSVDGFARVAHGSTYSDAPNAEVGYLKIEDEVIRWTGTTVDSVLGLCFVVGARGALGTRRAEHRVDASASTDRKTEVTEFVYLELPAIKLIYALITGNLYGQPGKSLPSGWHLAISGTYIRTADFINIGLDLWNPATDDGLVVRFAGEKAQDGKQFIEQQLCLLTSTYMPTYSNGEWGLRRFTSILHEAPYVAELNDQNVVRYGELSIDARSVFNILSLEWNYDHLQEKLTRQKIVVDTESLQKYGSTPTKSLQFRGLHGSRHTATTVESLFDRLRDRYAAPPHRLPVRGLPYLNYLEVGDIVRVRTAGKRDYFRSSQLFDRSMEVQRVSTDWTTGQVDFDLFGSTQPASAIAPSVPGNGNPDPTGSVLPDGWYTGSGTNIAGYGGVSTTVTGGVRHITGGSGLVGNDVVGVARYYCDGDLELNSGVTLPFTKNAVLVVKGHLQINGLFDGIGRGRAGAAAVGAANYDSHAQGVAGYLGPTLSGGGMQDRYVRVSGPSNNQTWLDCAPGYQQAGAVSVVPRLEIAYVGGVLSGLPADLQGTSGSTGRVADNGSGFVAGGAGGASGAGLIIIARGVSFGAAGEIRSSGSAGSAGAGPSGDVYGGAGAGGAPGAVIILLDGLNSEIPDLSHVTAIWGASPVPGGATVLSQPSTMVKTTSTVNVTPPYYSYYSGYGATPPDLSGYAGACRMQYIPPVNSPTQDVPRETSTAIALALSELTNTPPTIDRSQSTIEVTVTPPSDGNYAYSNIYYKRSTATQWVYSGPADDEWDIVVPADGTTYDVLARPVSIFGVESSEGVSQSIAISSAASQAPADIRDIHTNYRDGFVEIYWAAMSDVRGLDYELRFGTSWIQSAVLGRISVNRYTANMAGTYWIAARVVDLNSASLYSMNPQSFAISQGVIVSNVVANYDEFVSGLPGTLDSGALIVSSKIRLQGTANILASSDFLAETNLLGVGSYVASGAYTASTHVIDIGREAPCAVSVLFASHNEDTNNNFTDAGLTSVRPQINVGNASGTYAGWQDYKPGNYYGRYFQFRILLESLDGTSTPVITAFSFSVDVPDRIDDGTFTTSTGGAAALTFSPAFNGGNGPSNTPIVTANIVGGSAGDQLFITSISRNSVYFEVKNGGASVARTVHYSIQGY